MTESKSYGKWEVVKPIGRGGQGKVYLVCDASGTPNTKDRLRNLRHAMAALVGTVEESQYEKFGLQFTNEIRRIAGESQAPRGALKELLPFEEGTAQDEATALERMKQELSVLESVNHPSLVKVLDSNIDQKWFVMEFFEGGMLSDHLGKYKGFVLGALRAFRPVVDAVVALHAKKVVHRDIKPDNIFVASDGHLVLADCGLAFRLENQERLTTIFENVGTREFQPPWSYGMRLADVQPAFDVFSLAKVLWAMVSGRPKFPLWYFDRSGHDLRQIFPDEPAVYFVHELLKKCVVESENEMKLRDAGELLGEIDTAMASVSSGKQLPGRNAKMRCQFCGVGTYKETRNVDIVGNLSKSADGTYYGTYYLCNHCGHLESFYRWRNQPAPAWEKS